MKTTLRHWRIGALGFLLATALCACLVPDGGVYVGGSYSPSGYEYGRWGSGYHVAPPRGGERGHGQASPRAYRPAPQNRPVPSIPSRPRGH
jgi:hypothetical protein